MIRPIWHTSRTSRTGVDTYIQAAYWVNCIEKRRRNSTRFSPRSIRSAYTGLIDITMLCIALLVMHIPKCQTDRSRRRARYRPIPPRRSEHADVKSTNVLRASAQSRPLYRQKSGLACTLNETVKTSTRVEPHVVNFMCLPRHIVEANSHCRAQICVRKAFTSTKIISNHM